MRFGYILVDKIAATSSIIMCWLLCCLLVAVAGACDFPYFMQTNGTDRDWRTRIKQQYSVFAVTVTVDKNVMRTVSTDEDVRSHTRVCLQSIGSNKFLVAHESAGQEGQRYTCVQFLQRSEHVIQLQEADVGTSMESSLCDKDNLVLNPWLLVDKTHVGDEPVSCGLQGGFSVRIYDSTQYKGMCDGYQGETRMESECVRGEGLTFYFRQQTCVPQYLYMRSTQHTICLANWSHGPTSFMLLKHSQMQYMWVMRYPSAMHDNFVAFVFYDMVADASNQITDHTYMRLDSVRDIPLPRTALCVDDYEMCSYYNKRCETDNLALTCPRTCRLCNSTRPTGCTLDSRYMGQWYNADNPGTLALTVNTTFMTTYDKQGYQERFHCIKWDPPVQEEAKYKSTRMVVTDFTNGCKPRYSCVSFLQKASSILFLKLSEGKKWPFTTTLEELADCSHFDYKEDTTLVPNMFKNDNYRLVYSRTSNSVPCELPGGLTNYAVSFKDGTSCTASLVGNMRVNGFTVMLNNCPEEILDTSHTCIESSRLLPSVLLIVSRSSRDPDRIYCWVFQRGNDQFYLLEPEHCNESVRRRMRKHRVKAIASFNKTRLLKNAQPRPSTVASLLPSPTPFPANATQPPNMEDRVGGSTTAGSVQPQSPQLNDTVVEASNENDTAVTATPFVIVAAILFFLVFQIPCSCRSS